MPICMQNFVLSCHWQAKQQIFPTYIMVKSNEPWNFFPAYKLYITFIIYSIILPPICIMHQHSVGSIYVYSCSLGLSWRLMCQHKFENYRYCSCKHNSGNYRPLTNIILELYNYGCSQAWAGSSEQKSVANSDMRNEAT